MSGQVGSIPDEKISVAVAVVDAFRNRLDNSAFCGSRAFPQGRRVRHCGLWHDLRTWFGQFFLRSKPVINLAAAPTATFQIDFERSQCYLFVSWYFFVAV
jgi:hypothetical protein